MNRRLLPTLATAVLATAGWLTLAVACPSDAKDAQAAGNKSGVCTAAMAAKCTPAQAAACKANAAAAVSAEGTNHCSGKGAAVTASAGGKSACPYASAVQAAVAGEGHTCGGAKSAFQTAGASGCAHESAANAAACKGHGAAASANMCKGMVMTAGACKSMSTAGANGCKSGVATTADAGMCGGHGKSMAAGEFAHGDCDACADMVTCEGELKAAGGIAQAVPLKNGVMFVYTAENPNQVRAVQAAMARRHERWSAMTAAGDKARLCAECKTMRGAVASGKLTREIVNIEGGCLTLMTSSDPRIVAKLHALAGTRTASRIKT